MGFKLWSAKSKVERTPEPDEEEKKWPGSSASLLEKLEWREQQTYPKK